MHNCLNKIKFFFLSGVAIGAGWQGVVAFVNIGCYYGIGIPLGVLLAYVVDLSVTVRTSVSPNGNLISLQVKYRQLMYY